MYASVLFIFVCHFYCIFCVRDHNKKMNSCDKGVADLNSHSDVFFNIIMIIISGFTRVAKAVGKGSNM